MGLPFPEGAYGLYADDDDVIGMAVARTYPQGWPIVRTNPPLIDAFDEFDIGTFLAKCLTHRGAVVELLDRLEADDAR